MSSGLLLGLGLRRQLQQWKVCVGCLDDLGNAIDHGCGGNGKRNQLALLYEFLLWLHVQGEAIESAGLELGGIIICRSNVASHIRVKIFSQNQTK